MMAALTSPVEHALLCWYENNPVTMRDRSIYTLVAAAAKVPPHGLDCMQQRGPARTNSRSSLAVPHARDRIERVCQNAMIQLPNEQVAGPRPPPAAFFGARSPNSRRSAKVKACAGAGQSMRRVPCRGPQAPYFKDRRVINGTNWSACPCARADPQPQGTLSLRCTSQRLLRGDWMQSKDLQTLAYPSSQRAGRQGASGCMAACTA